MSHTNINVSKIVEIDKVGQINGFPPHSWCLLNPKHCNIKSLYRLPLSFMMSLKNLAINATNGSVPCPSITMLREVIHKKKNESMDFV